MLNIYPPLSQLEIQEALIKTSKISPGADKIPIAILRLAWPLIEIHIYLLFNSCLSLLHHPEYFRRAILIMLPKPNKSDLSSPRSYRLIAFLSVLWRDLERLIAK